MPIALPKPVKTKASRTGTEDMHQMELIRWAKKAVIGGIEVAEYLFHIPNGGKRSIATAKRLKAMGVKAGVSDLFLPVPRGGYPGLWIELKAEGGRTSEEQDDWLEKMRVQGYRVAVCVGWLAAKELITEYLHANSKKAA
jgi:hypothetical protein